MSVEVVQLVQAVVSGLIGGVAAGAAALAVVNVRIQWLRRDVDYLLRIKDE